MTPGNPVAALHAALAHAMYEGFSPIEYEDRDWAHFRRTREDRRIKKTRRPGDHDITVYAMFIQTWGSTALGFAGMGGASMTPAYTTVLECAGEFCVYFGGRFAYKVTSPTPAFGEAIAQRWLAKVSECGRYFGATVVDGDRPAEGAHAG
jgi:hypothetical protein